MKFIFSITIAIFNTWAISLSKKALLATLLYYSGLITIIGRIRSLVVSEIRILAYHRVLDRWAEEAFPGDLELVSASSSEFNWQLQYLKRHYKVISVDTLISYIDAKESLPKGAILLTFDDGFEDNYLNAFPILRKNSIPATIFVSTNYIESNKTFWFERLAEQIKLLSGSILHLPSIKKTFNIPNDSEGQNEVISEILTEMKFLDDTIRRRVVQEIASKIQHEHLQVDSISKPMTWDQINEMVAQGIRFGSHGTDHAILSRVDEANLKLQLFGSKYELESHTDKNCDTIAYPVGGEEAFNDAVINKAKELGYKLGFSYISGTNSLKNMNCFRLKRIHVERYTTRPLFAASLALPHLFL